MGLAVFILKMLWGELCKRLLPSWKDVALSLVLTLIFAIACTTTTVGIAVFYVIALLLIYAIPRLAFLMRAYLKYRRAKKSIGGLAGKLTGMVKK